ncbi:MAG: hypothetical protein ABSG64_00335 [Solirubrobacteraceae bacterium]
MRALASRLAAEADKINSSSERIRSGVDGLAFEGPAAVRFTNVSATLRTDLVTQATKLIDTANYLKVQAGRLEELQKAWDVRLADYEAVQAIGKDVGAKA